MDKKCLKIAWCGEVNQPCVPQLPLKFYPPQSLTSCDENVVAIDVLAFNEIDSIEETYRHIRKPVLFLVDDSTIDVVMRWIRPSDLALDRTTSSALVGQHLIHLHTLVSNPARDGLTGLCNRVALFDFLSENLPFACVEKTFSLVLADVDHFKRLNDRYGHTIGDRVLQQISEVFMAHSPEASLISRFGGEEFAFVYQCEEGVGINHAESLRQLIKSHRFTQDIQVTLSFGVASTTTVCQPSELMDEANEALYSAKASGRDCTRSYEEIRRRALEKNTDPSLENLENLSRVVSERVAQTITRKSRKLLRELRNEADHDGLTRLYNRRAFDRKFHHEFGKAAEMTSTLTIALLDIDHFGKINKQFGWPTGDRVLADFSELVRSSIRTSDWLARYGGEEFCLVMPGTAAEQSRNVLERIRSKVESHQFLSTSDHPIQVTISAGIAEFKDDEIENERSLIERASDHLLEAKRMGRNRICSIIESS